HRLQRKKDQVRYCRYPLYLSAHEYPFHNRRQQSKPRVRHNRKIRLPDGKPINHYMPLKPSLTSPHRIASLDGLRGIAVLLVFTWHYLPATHSFFPGWTGVDLFFVLSGYLITQRLMATRQTPNYFSHFYRNRALRIFPLYYTFVIGFLLLAHFFVRPQ